MLKRAARTYTKTDDFWISVLQCDNDSYYIMFKFRVNWLLRSAILEALVVFFRIILPTLDWWCQEYAGDCSTWANSLAYNFGSGLQSYSGLMFFEVYHHKLFPKTRIAVTDHRKISVFSCLSPAIFYFFLLLCSFWWLVVWASMFSLWARVINSFVVILLHMSPNTECHPVSGDLCSWILRAVWFVFS